MQIGGMRFARVERNDHALVREVDFYILYSGDVRQHRSQFAHTLIAIFTFRGDLEKGLLIVCAGTCRVSPYKNVILKGLTEFW
jgi:hypothetical protein